MDGKFCGEEGGCVADGVGFGDGGDDDFAGGVFGEFPDEAAGVGFDYLTVVTEGGIGAGRGRGNLVHVNNNE